MARSWAGKSTCVSTFSNGMTRPLAEGLLTPFYEAGEGEADPCDPGFQSSRWEQALVEQGLAVIDPALEVDPEGSDRRTSGGRSPDQDWAVIPEVARPVLAARVEEDRNPLSQRIDASEVRAFGVVARETGEGQVVRDRRAAVALGNDVIDLESVHIQRLGNPAVFTTRPSP